MIIPKNMNNEESMLVAGIVCLERELVLAQAKYEAFKARKNKNAL